MILLDTGYFIALFTPDDNLHERASAWCRHVNESLLACGHHFEQAGFEALLRKDPPAS